MSQFTYVQAVLKHGNLLTTDDIERARGIAGLLYQGSLKDYFLIIEEVALPETIPAPRPSSVSGQPITTEFRSSFVSVLKRKLEEDGSKQAEKRKK